MVAVMGIVGLRAEQARADEPQYRRDSLIVRFEPEFAEYLREAVCDVSGAEVQWYSHRLPGLTVFKFDAEEFEYIEGLCRGLFGVQYVTYDWMGQFHSTTVPCPETDPPDDPLYGYQWHVNSDPTYQAIKAPCAWTVITCISDAFPIAVLDQGYDTANTTDFYSNLWQNTGETSGNNIDDDVNGFCDDRFGAGFFGTYSIPGCTLDTCVSGMGTVSSGSVECSTYHGDMIMNVIGGRGNNSQGGTGVAWDSTMMCVRVVDDVGLTESRVLAGIEYALDNGAKIINMSFALPSDDPPPTDPLYDLMEGAEEDALFVCSAGNEGEEIDYASSGVYRRPQLYQLCEE